MRVDRIACEPYFNIYMHVIVFKPHLGSYLKKLDSLPEHKKDPSKFAPAPSLTLILVDTNTCIC